MGCHTWEHTKTPLTYKDVLPKVIETYRWLVKIAEEYVNDITPDDELYLWGDCTKEEAIQLLDIRKRQIRMIEKGLCQKAVMRKYADETCGEYDGCRVSRYCDSNGYLYRDVNDVWVKFRCKHYPNDELHSAEEAKQFYLNPDNKCYVNNHEFKYPMMGKYPELDKEVLDSIDNFFEKYPEGMITFG